MGKQQEANLWDDSALINAFDDAMSAYKKMHNKKSNEGSTKEDTVIPEVNEIEEAQRNGTPKTTTEIGEASILPELRENHGDSHVPEPYSQSVEDYNQLVNQYYEVEEKRQKLLERLHQFGGWNYQYSGEGSGSAIQGDTAFISQQHAVPTCQSSDPAVCCSCCPYICQCLMAPCTSFPASVPGGSCVGRTCRAAHPGTSFSPEYDRIVKTGMGTAERALSAMKMQTSTDANITHDKKDEKDEGEMAGSTSSETDLTAVLNAWYSAGFYTGKYLVEQSIAKKQHS